MGTWDVESTREQFLEVVGRNEILILRVLTNETGDVGTERNNPEIIDAGEIERYAGEFCSHALAFEWLRHFGVGINDAAGEAAITDKGAKARSEEHTSELQSRLHLVCRLLLENKKTAAYRARLV